MATRKGVNRYPRPGERIAPATLSHVLSETAPDYLVAGTPAAGLRLIDLDESVWDKLDPKRVSDLAELVVARVGNGCSRRLFNGRHFPRPPQGLRLDQLGLEHRTALCLTREGFDDDPQRLGELTVDRVLQFRAFGPRCLVDLLCAVESRLARGHRLDRMLTAEARRLLALPGAEEVRADDARFRAVLREVHPNARTAKEAAERLLARTQDPPDAAYVAEQVRRLRELIAALGRRTLEEELISIFASTARGRNRDVLIGYYGWDDGQCHTLAEIGERFGVTRERTRQICAKLVRRDDSASLPAPMLDRVLGFFEARLPRSVESLERDLREAGLTAIPMRLENVEVAARLLGRRMPLKVVAVGTGRLAVRPEQATVPTSIFEIARKEAFYHGASCVERIVALAFDKHPGLVDKTLVHETLQLLDGFAWLDRASGWFRLANACKHGLPKTIDKVLAVAGRVRLVDLQSAIGRSRKVWKSPPPTIMLAEFCRQTPGLRVEGDWVVADPPRDWRQCLSGVEAQLVRILKQHGPVMERGALEDLCVGEGMNRFSFHAFIACSPVIAQYGHSIYGLLGAAIAPAAIRAMAQRKADRAAVRVLDGHGRTSDGRVWLRYRLSKAASTYAVVTVPAELKGSVSGKFDLLSDGRRVGVLAAKDGRAWGLGSFLRRSGVQADDTLLLTVDLDKREAVVALNDASPALSAAAHG